ncbi:FAD binding domain protein [Hypoxylon trugodes]|uniref:FAD binding domain protein n=1 Tax=Hypoxylon trugodes TaxID=326681 RepID=UPI00219294C5|nr:FAD binding domain protein [Hypoxylon trugodes]KAI1387175.1 FAD binding domain protein [Hypoxylon trugodes]
MAGEDQKLSVIIIGSGLAGLVAARILREKAQVTVYERGEPSVATGGQGIANFPNAINIMKQLGYDPERSGSVPIQGFRTRDKLCNMIFDTGFPFEEKYGSPCLSHMRVDFRAELLRIATAPSKDLGIGGDPAKVVFRNGAKDIDPEAGEVTLDDGTKVKADVVIIADGIHSRLRPKIVGENSPQPQKTGLTCCRVAIDANKAIEAYGRLPEWWEEQKTSEKRITIYEAGDGSDRIMVVYPLRHLSYMNMSCIYATTEEKESTTVSWMADGNREEMLEIFHDFHPSLKALLGAATEVKVWELQDLEPLDTWVKGRAILIGDAAHAMTPLQGQGANAGIEDAEAFRLLLEPGVTSDDVHGILKRIESVRLPRATAVLNNTRAMSRGIKGDERYQRMDENCTYHGIYKALEDFEKVK